MYDLNIYIFKGLKMDITLKDFDTYKLLIDFLEKDHIDYNTYTKDEEIFINIEHTYMDEEIKKIINPNSILSMFQ
jgi:predicted GNAT family acetyltransferase